MNIKIANIELKNPIMPASGCFGFGKDFNELYDLNILGAICIKSATLEPRAGNKTPRIAETPSGMLNAIGLQNPGVDKIVQDELPFLKQFNTPVFANIAGASEDEYIKVIEKLNDEDVISAFELNISCPNVKHGGLALGTDAKLVENITKLAKKASKKPLFVKLSPNVTDITSIAKAAEDGGADALVLINTLLGLRLDLKTAKPILANTTGGLSGPAIKPVALRMVYEVYKNVKIPIIGVGGISNAKDVLEFLYAGASAVQIGAMNFIDPFICPKIINELPKLLKEHNLSLKDAIARSHNV